MMNVGTKPEAAFRQFAEKHKLTPTKRGWPDFFCWNHDKFIVVEVKATKRESLSKWQLRVMEALRSVGIETYRWSPDSGDLMPFDTMPEPKPPVEKSRYETFRKRPKSATIEKLREFRARGLSYGDIAKIWGISRVAVWRLDHPNKEGGSPK